MLEVIYLVVILAGIGALLFFLYEAVKSYVLVRRELKASNVRYSDYKAWHNEDLPDND